MPTYDYSCNHCGRAFALFYKSYKDYDAAVPACPHCQATDVSRKIKGVTIASPSRNLANLTSGDMLSVLDSGDSKEVGKLFQQVGESAGADMGQTYQEATQRLLKGESIPSVEKSLESKAKSGDSTA